MRKSTLILVGAGLILVCAIVFVSVLVYVSLARGSAALSSSGPGTTNTGAATTGPQAEAQSWYEVYFTSPRYPDDKANHHGGLDEKLTGFINGAQRSVDVAIFQLDLANVTDALVAAKGRGVNVRVVTDIDTLNDDKENASFKTLLAAGIPVVGGNPNGIMHDKFVVVDGAAVWTGSWNFTENDTYRYNNNAILIRLPQLASNYAATFEKMFSDRSFGGARKAGGTAPVLTIDGARIESYFSPEDHVAEKVADRLKAATRTIDFMSFSFTEDNIGQAILDATSRGVRIRGIFEKTGSETRFSEFGKFKKAGLDVLQDGNPYLMHHKVFVVDAQTVVFGSFNFSTGANEDNDENLLMIQDPGLVRAFDAEFAKVYDQAVAKQGQ